MQRCPLCGNNNFAEIFPTRNLRAKKNSVSDYARCASCGALFHINSSDDVNEQNNYNERYSKTYKRFIIKLKNKLYKSFACKMYGLLSGFSHTNLPKLFSNGDALLDVGCGIGLQTKPLQKRGLKITGIDSSAQAIDFAKQISDGETFIHANLSDFTTDEKFNFIRLDNVIEHLDTPNEFLDKLKRLLKSSGKIIIFTPNAESATLKFLKGKSVSAWPGEHSVIYSEKALTQLLEKNNFRVQTIKKNTPAWWLAYNFLMLIGLGDKVTADSFLLKLLSLFFLPFTHLLNFLNLNEEIVVIADKY